MDADLFSAWADAMELSDQELAKRLGISRTSFATYRSAGAPVVVGLACAALARNLTEWGTDKLSETISEEDEPLNLDVIDDATFKKYLSLLSASVFTTQDFVNLIQKLNPSLWRQIVKRYGDGGSGAKVHYSAFSFASQILSRKAAQGLVARGRFVSAPAGWGSPVIRSWKI